MLKSGRGVRGALKAPAPAARSPPSQGCHEPEEEDGESMELRAAAALCLCCLWSACRLRYGQLDAAVVRPLAAASDAAAAAAPGLWKSKPGERLNGDSGVFGNGTVVPHDYMIALYRRLAGGQGPPRPKGEISDAPGSLPNTVTGFADQAWAQPRGERTNRPESPPRAPPPKRCWPRSCRTGRFAHGADPGMRCIPTCCAGVSPLLLLPLLPLLHEAPGGRVGLVRSEGYLDGEEI